MVEVVFAPDGTATYNRYAFYQWDAGQKLKIIGLSLEPTVEIHFANKGLPAVVMLGETENGVTIVDVPDIVLQRYGELNVYIYRNDGTLNYTSHALLFTVRKRERPVDYVEQVQPGIIAQLVNKLNKVIETGIASYEPDANVVNQMIKDYVSTNMIANNQATTEAGYALDARQANPSIEGTLGAQIMSLNNNLAKMPFTCTALSGYTIASSNCFVQNKIAYINLRIEKIDGSSFSSDIQDIAKVPHTPVSAVTALCAIGLSAGGVLRTIEQCGIYTYNRSISIKPASTDTKSVYITGTYEINNLGE